MADNTTGTLGVNEAEDVECCGRLDSFKDQARERLVELRDKTREGYQKAAAQLHETLDKVGDTSLHDVQVSVRRYVRQNPGKSLLMAAAAGFVIGSLLRRRH